MNKPAEIMGLAMNLEAAARRLQYLTARGYVSPEQQEEIRSIINDINGVSEDLEAYK